jgi:hypothetical protein
MESASTGKEIVQVAIIVKDVEDTTRKLEKMIGIGPFDILEPDYRDMTFQGRVGKFKIKIG